MEGLAAHLTENDVRPLQFLAELCKGHKDCGTQLYVDGHCAKIIILDRLQANYNNTTM